MDVVVDSLPKFVASDQIGKDSSLAVTVNNNNNNQHVSSILRNCCRQDAGEESLQLQ